MQTIELGTEIRDLPGIEFIRIEPSDKSDQGVHVLVQMAALANPISFGIVEFAQVAEAVRMANDRAAWLAERNAP